jgi:hypothetical protein
MLQGKEEKAFRYPRKEMDKNYLYVDKTSNYQINN